MGVVRQAVDEVRSSVAVVGRNRRLRSLHLAAAGSMTGEWALATAITVWAYGAGGATFLGVWGAIRVAALAFATPFGSEWANRHHPQPVMVSTDLIRAVLTLVAAAVIFWEGPTSLVLTLAILTLLVGSPFRQAQASLTAVMVEHPRELTGATRVLVTLESTALIVGPLIAGLLLSVADVVVIYVLRAATLIWSAVMVTRIGPTQSGTRRRSRGGDVPNESAVGDSPRAVARSVAGFAVLRRNRDLRLIAALFCAQCLLAGASIVFTAAIAFDLVGLGASGVGYLGATVGAGAQIGVLVAIVLAPRRRLATDFGLGTSLWALSLLVVAAWPITPAAFITMALIGMANPVVDTNASIVLQRITPQQDRSRAFAALESALLTSMAVGAIAMPLLMGVAGLRLSLVILAVPIAVFAIAAVPRLRHLDRTTLEEGPVVGLLDSMPIFQELERPLLETLSGQFTREVVVGGTVILRAGDSGEHFFVIESGCVKAIDAHGRLVNQMGPGDCFGEIALLRDVPRTLTVVAAQDTVLHILEREDFMAATSRDSGFEERMDALASVRLQQS